jgi:hypothetical protein
MPRGGRREGAGRKPGSRPVHPVRTRRAVVAMEAAAAGLSPVDYDAAKSVAPYTNPRLAVIDSNVTVQQQAETQLTAEERRERARQAIREAFAERPAIAHGSSTPACSASCGMRVST